MGVSALLLAGGRGSRFQRTAHEWVDKLLAVIDGKPLIKWVYDSVSNLVDQVIISTNSEDRGLRYKEILGDRDVKISVDKSLGCRGPLQGIASSAVYAEQSIVIVLPADMPFIKTSSIKTLIESIEDAEIVAPIWFDGISENLFFAARREYLFEMSSFLCSNGYWSPSGLLRGARKAKFKDVSKIVSSPRELININYQVDLEHLKPRKQLMEGYDVDLENDYFRLDGDSDLSDLASKYLNSNNHFLAGVIYYSQATHGEITNGLRSIKSFDLESRKLYELGLFGLMALAYYDAGKVAETIGLKFLSEQYRKKYEKLTRILESYPKRPFIENSYI